jgi:D-alanine-D-alanine ligase
LRRTAAAPDEWEFFVIEANPNPYLDRRSEVALAAEREGRDFPALLEHIIELAMRRTARPSA